MARFRLGRRSVSRILLYIIILVLLTWNIFYLFWYTYIDKKAFIQKSDLCNLYNNKPSNIFNQTKTFNRSVTLKATNNQNFSLNDPRMIIVGLDNIRNCTKRDVKLAKKPMPVTGLVSFPGSGNTWVRHLVQQMTGIGTSSMYCDGALRKQGFPFECNRQFPTTVLVKTHEESHFKHFKKIVLLVRNPYDAFMSYFAMVKAGHTGHPTRKSLQEACKRNFNWSVWWYTDLINGTLTRYKGPVYVLKYDRLKTDMANELEKLAKFLEVNVTQNDIACTVKLQEGNFHRKTNDAEHLETLQTIYDKDKLLRLKKVSNTANKLIKGSVGFDIDIGDTVEKVLLEQMNETRS